MRIRRWFLGAAVLSLGACSAHGPLLQELGPGALYERGMQKVESKDWTDAIRTLEQLTSRFPNDPRIQEVRFQIGNAYFARKEFVTAAAEYVRLATDYPTGEYADDARFKTCQSYYRLSPDAQLDQEYTRAAIEHCQALVTYFPASEFTPQARDLVAELQNRLARKAYLNGDYYYKRQAYDSSIIYFEDVLERFPQSDFAPRSLLRLVQVYQRLGYQEELDEAKSRLLRDYPDSAEAAQAREITPADQR